MKEVVSDENGQKTYHMILAEEVSFFNKANIVSALERIPANSKVIIDCSKSVSISYDVVELIRDFRDSKRNNISVEAIKFIEPIA